MQHPGSNGGQEDHQCSDQSSVQSFFAHPSIKPTLCFCKKINKNGITVSIYSIFLTAVHALFCGDIQQDDRTASFPCSVYSRVRLTMTSLLYKLWDKPLKTRTNSNLLKREREKPCLSKPLCKGFPWLKSVLYVLGCSREMPQYSNSLKNTQTSFWNCKKLIPWHGTK